MKWAIVLLVVGVAGCISLPVPPPVVEPEPPPIPSWVVVIATVPDARVTAYREDAADLALDATADADGFVRGELEQAGYTFCADLDGYVSKCVGVDVVKEATPVALHLEAVPPPEPEPVPVPPPPAPAACASVRPGDNLYPCLHEVATGRGAVYWQGCERGNGVSCFRWTVVVADVLAEHDARWGVLRKESPGQKCDWHACGNLAVGWGEDIITYRLTEQEWRSWDIVTGAGSPGASYRGWHEVTGVGAPRPRYYWGASSMVQR